MSTVLFTSQAADRIATLATAAGDGLETGGILLGADHGLAGPIAVRHCGDPGPAAIRRRAYLGDGRNTPERGHGRGRADVVAGQPWAGADVAAVASS